MPTLHLTPLYEQFLLVNMTFLASNIKVRVFIHMPMMDGLERKNQTCQPSRLNSYFFDNKFMKHFCILR